MRDALFETPVFRIAGDKGLLVEFGEGIHPDINARVRSMARRMTGTLPKGVTEIIPTYRSLLLVYDPLETTPEKLQRAVTAAGTGPESMDAETAKTVEIPVCYGGDLGPDLEHVAEIHGLTTQEVVAIHSERAYQIYMVGFTPGFPFLGGLDERLHTPRLETPRTNVPQGSVGIANNQTGIYPVDSPGGWQLIGCSPVRLFAPERPDPFLYRAGDRLKFTPVTREDYDRIAREEAAQ